MKSLPPPDLVTGKTPVIDADGEAAWTLAEEDARQAIRYVRQHVAYRNATPVPADAPPLFIAIAADDHLISPQSSARLYEAWHSAGLPAELHIFRKGDHGFGMKKQNLPSDARLDMFQAWLESSGLLSAPSTR